MVGGAVVVNELIGLVVGERVEVVGAVAHLVEHAVPVLDPLTQQLASCIQSNSIKFLSTRFFVIFKNPMDFETTLTLKSS